MISTILMRLNILLILIQEKPSFENNLDIPTAFTKDKSNPSTRRSFRTKSLNLNRGAGKSFLERFRFRFYQKKKYVTRKKTNLPITFLP